MTSTRVFLARLTCLLCGLLFAGVGAYFLLSKDAHLPRPHYSPALTATLTVTATLCILTGVWLLVNLMRRYRVGRYPVSETITVSLDHVAQAAAQHLLAAHRNIGIIGCTRTVVESAHGPRINFTVQLAPGANIPTVTAAINSHMEELTTALGPTPVDVRYLLKAAPAPRPS